MKVVDSTALLEVNRALGLTGRGSAITEFLDGQVDQVLDIGPLVRRGRSIGDGRGIFFGVLRNTHAGADTQVSAINPYAPAAGNIHGYPDIIPVGYDVWLIGAAVDQLSGAGTLEALLFMDPPANMQGWGIDQAGVAVVTGGEFCIARWDAVVTSTEEVGIQADGLPWARLGIRMMRGHQIDARIRFSTTSSAAAVFDCFILLAVVPIALGQDVGF